MGVPTDDLNIKKKAGSEKCSQMWQPIITLVDPGAPII